MSDNVNVKENIENIKENVEKNFEFDMRMKKLKEELAKKFEDYQKTLKFMAADVPIEVLCLPKPIEKILIDEGLLRIYDLFNLNFVEIKGLGVVRINQLTTRLDQFFSML